MSPCWFVLRSLSGEPLFLLHTIDSSQSFKSFASLNFVIRLLQFRSTTPRSNPNWTIARAGSLQKWDKACKKTAWTGCMGSTSYGNGQSWLRLSGNAGAPSMARKIVAFPRSKDNMTQAFRLAYERNSQPLKKWQTLTLAFKRHIVTFLNLIHPRATVPITGFL